MNILIYMTGSLGDTLVTLPALWAIRDHWPKAVLTLLSDASLERKRVMPEEVLGGAGLVDRFLTYPASEGRSSARRKIESGWSLWRLLRRERPDVLVWLVRAFSREPRMRRDLRFFRLAGVRKVIGCAPLPGLPRGAIDNGLPRWPHVSELHLEQVKSGGVPVPPLGQGRMDLRLNVPDRLAFMAWRRGLPAEDNRPWVAFGIGSNRPSTRWAPANYAEVGERLIREFNICPIVFGGAGDRAGGAALVARWGRGHVAAGRLSVRASAVALQACGLYVGNDTGIMHLAAAAGIRCVAVCSARNPPGLWDPYGVGHVVVRADVPCAGCGQHVCPKESTCLASIQPDAVYAACAHILEPATAGQRTRDPGRPSPARLAGR